MPPSSRQLSAHGASGDSEWHRCLRGTRHGDLSRRTEPEGKRWIERLAPISEDREDVPGARLPVGNSREYEPSPATAAKRRSAGLAQRVWPGSLIGHAPTVCVALLSGPPTQVKLLPSTVKAGGVGSVPAAPAGITVTLAQPMLRSTLDALRPPAVRVPSGFPELSHGSSHLRDRSCLAARLNSARDIWPRDRTLAISRRQRAISRAMAYGSMSRCRTTFRSEVPRSLRPHMAAEAPPASNSPRFHVRLHCPLHRRENVLYSVKAPAPPAQDPAHSRLRRRRPGSMSWHTSRARTSGLGRDAPVTRRWLPVAAHRHLSSAGAQRAPRPRSVAPIGPRRPSLQPRRPVRLTHRGDGDDPAVAEDDVEPAVVNRDFRDVRPRDASGRKERVDVKPGVAQLDPRSGSP